MHFKLIDSLTHIRNLKTSGTVTPSSRVLINRLLAPIDFKKSRYIVELGAGNGCVTRALLERMDENCVLLCFEVNEKFATSLRTLTDPRVKIFNVCASSLRTVLNHLGVDKVDYVVSSLPLALIDNDLVSHILNNVNDNLHQGGRFLQYQYSLKNYSDVKPVFSDVKLRFTLRNMPPAFVYECRK